MTSDANFWFVLVWPLIAAGFAIFAALVIFPRFDAWTDARFPAAPLSGDPTSKSPAE